MERRVFVSVASNKNLDDRRKRVKAAVISEIQKAGYAPQEFWESGLPENIAWSFESVDRVMRKCVGAVVIGFPRWPDGIVGEYNHYEGAVANTLGLPLFLIAEQGVLDRGIVWTGGGKTITYMPADADETWVASPDFIKRFSAWRRELGARKDVFLAYCSKSAGTAAQIQLHLESKALRFTTGRWISEQAARS